MDKLIQCLWTFESINIELKLPYFEEWSTFKLQFDFFGDHLLDARVMQSLVEVNNELNLQNLVCLMTMIY